MGSGRPGFRNPRVIQPFTLFSTRTPQIWADIDRVKSERLGVPLGNVFDALSIYLGSAFVKRLQHPRPPRIA